MSPHPTLGFRTAKSIIELGRGAFFVYPAADLPDSSTAQIRSDDLLPQFGYVGSNYSSRRILFLGINPGNGPRDRRNSGDDVQMPALEAFATEPTERNFERAGEAYRRACQSWFIWGRECNELLSLGSLSIDDVAFSNALPWRTKSQAGYPRSVERRAAEHYVKPLLAELEPKVVVAVGKKVERILADAGPSSAALVVWNRARALTQSVRQERDEAGTRFRTLVTR